MTDVRSFEVTVEEDEEGNAILPFPPEMISEIGWLEGDELEFTINEDDSAYITNISWLARQKNIEPT